MKSQLERIRRILAIGGYLLLGLIAWYVEIEYRILERFKPEGSRGISYPSPEGIDNPLGQAAFEGNTRKLKELLASGAPVDLRDQFRRTALCLAAGMNHTEAALFLLEKGANPSGPTGNSNPLHWAARNGNLALAKALLERGANPNENDGTGTPIFTATLEAHDEVVRALIAGGAKTKLTDRWGETPLSLAEKQLSNLRGSQDRVSRRKVPALERIVVFLRESSR